MYILMTNMLIMTTMKRIKNFVLAVGLVLGLSSCEEWLTIQPDTQVTEEDMFKTAGGYYDALIGSYTLMRNNYSPDGMMVMSGVEFMANLWQTADGATSESYALHDYRADLVEQALGAAFLNQYEVIVNLNTLLNHLATEDGILTAEEHDLYRGEALGLRAFAHFDLIRLWGPMPTQVDENREYLPYETTVQLENYPYSTYRNYMSQLCADLDSAELLLSGVDEVVTTSMEVVDNSGSYRRNRMNYYAVLGLQARVHLWLGERDEALRYARMVIDAQSPNGNRQFTLGERTDFVGNSDGDIDRVLYGSEQLFGIHVEEFDDNMIADGNQAQFTQVESRVQELYLPSDFRLELWNKNPWSVNKYDGMTDYSSVSAVENSVPLIRLAEMYLIVAECAPLTEANEAYQEFLSARGAYEGQQLTDENRERELTLEYLREFYGEGQMFYVYKRFATERMEWGTISCGEDDYVVPLPLREISTAENY